MAGGRRWGRGRAAAVRVARRPPPRVCEGRSHSGRRDRGTRGAACGAREGGRGRMRAWGAGGRPEAGLAPVLRPGDLEPPWLSFPVRSLLRWVREGLSVTEVGGALGGPRVAPGSGPAPLGHPSGLRRRFLGLHSSTCVALTCRVERGKRCVRSADPLCGPVARAARPGRLLRPVSPGPPCPRGARGGARPPPGVSTGPSAPGSSEAPGLLPPGTPACSGEQVRPACGRRLGTGHEGL